MASKADEEEVKAEAGEESKAADEADDEASLSAGAGGDLEDELGGKPVLQLTKKQQELFPFLSAIRDGFNCHVGSGLE